ncbi:MAG: CvpA family protein [Clostridia bacterium]|nr:CvpA family protein [Clostridia bacterium]
MNTAISVAITVIFFACIVIGFVRGFFKGAIKSVVDVGVALLCAILALPITKGITRILVSSDILNKVANKLMEILPSGAVTYVDYVKDYLAGESTGEATKEILELIASLPTILLSPIVYLIVFVVLCVIGFIIASLIKLLACPKPKKLGWKILGGALSAGAYIVVFAVLLVPVIGYSNFAGNTAEHCIEVVEAYEEKEDENARAEAKMLSSDASQDEPTKEKIDLSGLKSPLNAVQKFTEPINDNFISKMVYALGGRGTFENLTTTKVARVKLNLQKEIDGLIDISGAAVCFIGTEPKYYDSEQSDAVSDINSALERSEYLPLLLSKAISFVANEYYQGNDVFGIEKPDFGEDFNPTFDRVLFVLKDTDSSDIRKDIKTISKIANGALETGLIGEVTSEEIDVWKIVENEELLEIILVELYNNERTRNMIPYVTSAITNYMYDLYDDINDTETQKDEFDYSKYNEYQLRQEAAYISSAIEEIHSFLDTINVSEEEFDPKEVIMTADFGALGRGLENLRQSIFTERLFKLLLHAVLRSEAITELGIVDPILIKNAEEEDSDLEGMLVARQNVMKLAIAIQEKEDSAQTRDLMEQVIEKLIAGDDESLSSIVTKDNLISLGMKESEAESIEGIVGSMLEGANNCEFESEAEQKEEIKKTEEIISAVGNTVLDKKAENMFDVGSDTTSATGMSAQEFVDSIIDSKLTSAMIQGASNGEDGETVDDPYKIQKELSYADKESISEAINNDYASEDTTDEQRKTLESLANIFGVTIEE